MSRKVDTVNPFDLGEALRAGLISEKEIEDALSTAMGGLLRDLPVPVALTLIWVHGGHRLAIPRGVRSDNQLKRLIGAKAADLLMARAGGDHISVPKLHSLRRLACDRCIVRLHATGKSVREIGRMIRLSRSLTERQLWRTLARSEEIKAAWK